MSDISTELQRIADAAATMGQTNWVETLQIAAAALASAPPSATECQGAEAGLATEELIERCMAAFPRDTAKEQSRYFEAVHQELAPFARRVEAERNAMAKQIAGLTQGLAQIAAECRKQGHGREVAARIYRAIADQRLTIPLARSCTSRHSA